MRIKRVAGIVLFMLSIAFCLIGLRSAYVVSRSYENSVVQIALLLAFAILMISVTGYIGLNNRWISMVFVGVLVIEEILFRHGFVISMQTKGVLSIFSSIAMFLLSILFFIGSFIDS